MSYIDEKQENSDNLTEYDGLEIIYLTSCNVCSFDFNVLP